MRILVDALTRTCNGEAFFMTVGLRESALLRAMGVDLWRVRGASAPARAATPSGEREDSIALRGRADATIASRQGARPWAEDSLPEMSRPASGTPARPLPRPAVDATRTPAAESPLPSQQSAADPMPFPRVDLRIWRTGIALFVATFEDRVSQRFLSDVQRAVDRNHERPDLQALPHFQWPPPEHPELASLRSLRSAWRALLQRQHRERPVQLMVLFGEATTYVSAIADGHDPAAPASAGKLPVAPSVLSVPALQELQVSPGDKRTLWTRLLDAT